MDKVRAKFHCSSVLDMGGQTKADFYAVHSGTGENDDFAKATPAGTFSLTIDAEMPASGFFKPGNQYYLDITEAPAE